MNPMKPRTRLFIDQYGQKVWARSVRDLREQVGGRVSRMYRDTPSGTMHVGYVVGSRWFSEFAPVVRPL